MFEYKMWHNEMAKSDILDVQQRDAKYRKVIMQTIFNNLITCVYRIFHIE